MTFYLVDSSNIVHDNLNVSIAGFSERAPIGALPFQYASQRFDRLRRTITELPECQLVIASHDNKLISDIRVVHSEEQDEDEEEARERNRLFHTRTKSRGWLGPRRFTSCCI